MWNEMCDVIWTCTTNVIDPFMYLLVLVCSPEKLIFSPGCWKLNEDKVWQDNGWLFIVNQTLSVQVQMLAVCILFLSFFPSLPLSFLLPLSLSLKQVCHCSIHWAFHIHSIFQLYYCVSWLTRWLTAVLYLFIYADIRLFQGMFSLVWEEDSCPVDIFSVPCSSTDVAG